MSDNGPRPRVTPCIARFVPQLDALGFAVDAVRIDVERGHGLSGLQVLLTSVVY
jgi:hypothetical protein